MGYTGTLRGNQIELDEAPSLPDGTRVRVSIAAEPPGRGSPEAVLELAGTLSDEEAESLLSVVRASRHIDSEMWNTGA